MTDEIKQAATDTANTGAMPPAEGAGAPEGKTDDLDTLLEQYRKETGSPGTPSAAPAASPAPADVVPRSEFEALRQEVVQGRMAKELDQLAKGVRAAGDIPDVISDDDIIGILDRRAAIDPALKRAWVESASDPKARATLIKRMGEDLGRKFAGVKGVDERATADREAVAASVRGSATKAPEGKAPDFSTMSDNEFRKQVAEKYGFNPF